MKEDSSTYPLVIMVNGTGITASTSATLDFMLNLNKDSNSDFYGKIDVNNIGVSGHSQGVILKIIIFSI